MQDAKAREHATSLFNSYGRWDLAAAAWHGGPKAANALRDKGSAGTSDGIMATDSYAATVVNLMGGSATASTTTGGKAVAQSKDGADKQANEAFRLPSDGSVYVVDGGAQFVVYELGQGVRIRFAITAQTDLGGRKPRNISGSDFHRLKAVDGGDATELDSMSRDWGTFGAYWENILTSNFPDGHEALKDPGVLAVMAEIAGRPDMGETEIQNRLKGTAYWKGSSDLQRQWNDLSDGEKALRVEEQKRLVADLWQRNVGEDLPWNDPRLTQWATQIASGQRGQGGVLNEDILPIARQNSESPRSRTERDESEAQLQRGNDIENKVSNVRSLFQKWGIQATEGQYAQWAKDITEGTKSDEDLLGLLQTQSKILYPWKDPTVATDDASQPWLATFERVLERPSKGLFDPVVQKALNSGTPLWEFEQELKSRPEWMATKNARDDITQTMSHVGQMMGFG